LFSASQFGLDETLGFFKLAIFGIFRRVSFLGQDFVSICTRI